MKMSETALVSLQDVLSRTALN